MKKSNLWVLAGLIIILLVSLVILLVQLFSVISKQSVSSAQEISVNQGPVFTPEQIVEPKQNFSPTFPIQQPDATPALAPTTNNPAPDAPLVYLHSIDDILSRQGQPAVTREEFACLNPTQSYSNLSTTCQEITFSDGSKSIIYITEKFGLIAREDFTPDGNTLCFNEFAVDGGYYDEKAQINIPYYPTVPIAGRSYNSAEEQISDALRWNGPPYCWFYEI